MLFPLQNHAQKTRGKCCFLCEQEVKHLGTHHEDILTLLRVYEDVENVHVVSERCDAELLEHLFTLETLSEADIAEIVCTLIKAVKTLHDHGEALHIV